MIIRYFQGITNVGELFLYLNGMNSNILGGGELRWLQMFLLNKYTRI